MSIKIYDLTLEPCPMNLVKFKYYYNTGEDFTVILNNSQEEAVRNIINFLNFKGAKFNSSTDESFIKLNVVLRECGH